MAAKNLEFAVAIDDRIDFALKGQYPCCLHSISGRALDAGLIDGDELITVNSEVVSHWPHDQVASLIFSQRQLVKIGVKRKRPPQLALVSPFYDAEFDAPSSPLMTLSEILHIRPQPKLPINENVIFIRSFNVSLNVLTCENALISLRKKMIRWAERHYQTVLNHGPAGDHGILRLSEDVLIVDRAKTSNPSLSNDADTHHVQGKSSHSFVPIQVKDVLVFGVLTALPSTWVLLVRGSRRCLRINLIHQFQQAIILHCVDATGIQPNKKSITRLSESKVIKHQVSTVLKPSPPCAVNDGDDIKENMYPVGYFPKTKCISDDRDLRRTSSKTLNKSVDQRINSDFGIIKHGSSSTAANVRSPDLHERFGSTNTQRLVPCNSLASLHDEQTWIRDFSDPAIALWSRSLSDLLDDPFGCYAFEKFLKSEYSSENIRFWTDCDHYEKTEDPLERRKLASAIWEKYLDSAALTTINVDSNSRQQCYDALLRKDSELDINLFRSIKEHIYNLMKYDSYQRFLKSPQYMECQNPLSSQPNCVPDAATSSVVKDDEHLDNSFREKSYTIGAMISPLPSANDEKSENSKKDQKSSSFPMFQWARAMAKWKKNAKQQRGSLSSNPSEIEQSPTCTLILPSNVSIRVNLRTEGKLDYRDFLSKKISVQLAPILRKLGLIWYRTYLEDSITGQEVDFSSICGRLFGRRLFVRMYCLSAFSMPDERMVICRSKPTQTIHKCVDNIRSSLNYSFRFDRLYFATLDTDIELLNEECEMSKLDNRCIAVRLKPIKLTEPRIHYDYFDQIPENDLNVEFDRFNVLKTRKVNRPSSCVIESSRVNGILPVQEDSNSLPCAEIVELNASSDRDSPPTAFRRQNQHSNGHSLPAVLVNAKSFDNVTLTSNDVRPDQFVFCGRSTISSSSSKQSSLSSIDSLQATTIFNNSMAPNDRIHLPVQSELLCNSVDEAAVD